MKLYEEIEERSDRSDLDFKKIALVIMIPVIAVLVGLIYFGVIPLDLKLNEPIVEIKNPIESEPKPIEIPEVMTTVNENPSFLYSNKEGLLPTSPQNIDNTPNTESLIPTTPQPNKPKPVQSGNLDDIESKYRRFLESNYSVDEILFIQNTPCSELTSSSYDKYNDIIGEKGC